MPGRGCYAPGLSAVVAREQAISGLEPGGAPAMVSRGRNSRVTRPTLRNPQRLPPGQCNTLWRNRQPGPSIRASWGRVAGVSSAPHVGMACSSRNNSSSAPASVAAGVSAGSAAQESLPGMPNRFSVALEASALPSRSSSCQSAYFSVTSSSSQSSAMRNFPKPREEGAPQFARRIDDQGVLRCTDENIALNLPFARIQTRA